VPAAPIAAPGPAAGRLPHPNPIAAAPTTIAAAAIGRRFSSTSRGRAICRPFLFRLADFALMRGQHRFQARPAGPIGMPAT